MYHLVMDVDGQGRVVWGVARGAVCADSVWKTSLVSSRISVNLKVFLEYKVY